MEDLREQKQGQWITTMGDVSLWSINLDKNVLFNEVSTRSLYFVNNNADKKSRSDSVVIMDDDKNLYNLYLEKAVQDLLVVLARRIPQNINEYKDVLKQEGCGDGTPIYDDSVMLELYMVMSINHDKNLIVPLKVACKEFLVNNILEQWYGIDFGSEKEKSKIIHILQYRRKSPNRRVRPLL